MIVVHFFAVEDAVSCRADGFHIYYPGKRRLGIALPPHHKEAFHRHIVLNPSLQGAHPLSPQGLFVHCLKEVMICVCNSRVCVLFSFQH